MFSRHYLLRVMKETYKKSLLRKEKKSLEKPTKPFPNKWKKKLAKSKKSKKWINEHEYEKGRYYNEYYDDDLDLVTTDEALVVVNRKLSHIMTL